VGLGKGQMLARHTVAYHQKNPITEVGNCHKILCCYCSQRISKFTPIASRRLKAMQSHCSGPALYTEAILNMKIDDGIINLRLPRIKNTERGPQATATVKALLGTQMAHSTSQKSVLQSLGFRENKKHFSLLCYFNWRWAQQ
jgi:hypothetical protein